MRTRVWVFFLFFGLAVLLVGCGGGGSTSFDKNANFRFTSKGTFKILEISDNHFGVERDDVGIALIESLLDAEQPNLVIVNGDSIDMRAGRTLSELKTTISYVAYAMESRSIPWAVTFGNHDDEAFKAIGLTKTDMMSIYESYPHNVNSEWVSGTSGVGNKCIMIWNSAGTAPLFDVWLVDSGSDPSNFAEDRYDYIRSDQIAWYISTTSSQQSQYGHKIPGIMFFHIPLPEFRLLGMTGTIYGDRNENECPSATNSGMFRTVLEQNNVKGIFCGHDHVNNYVGLLEGIALGYDSAVGSKAYDVESTHPSYQRTRGGRVFLINQSDPTRYQTWMRYRDGTTSAVMNFPE